MKYCSCNNFEPRKDPTGRKIELSKKGNVVCAICGNVRDKAVLQIMEAAEIQNGQTIIGGNIRGMNPDTDSLAGKKDLCFISVNLRNVKLGVKIKSEGGYDVYPNNIRIKDCMTYQGAVVKKLDPNFTENLNTELEGAEAVYGKDVLLERISQKYNLEPKVLEIQ